MKLLIEYEIPDYEFYDTVNPMDLLKEEIQKLSFRYKEVILMKDIQGMTYEEMSKELEFNINTLKLRVHKARKKLGKNLLKRDPKFLTRL